MKKYKLMLTALLGAAFLFAPHESVSAAEPSDVICVSVGEASENAESGWLSGYYYELVDDDVNEPVVMLKKCYLSGDVSVPGTATVGGRTYRTLITKECFSNCAGITSLRFCEDGGMKPLASVDMTEAFSYDPFLQSIDISGLDLSKTQKINRMFAKNEGLSELILSNASLGNAYSSPTVEALGLFSESPSITSLDLSGFDTTNVVDMSHIFSSMKGLRSLKFGGVFDTSNVRDLSYAFYDCPSFTGTLDLSAWNAAGKSSTSKNTTMRSMFELFPAREIILTGFDTSNVGTMAYAFADTSFSAIDLSSFDTSGVENMYAMFDGTKVDDDYLDAIIFGSGWDTQNVKHFSFMFNHRFITNSCANVFAAATETDSATNMFQMFYDTKVDCGSNHAVITNASLNLSSWNVSSVIDCRNFLKSGTVSCDLNGWNYSNMVYGDNAFGGQASRANPASTAQAIESKLTPIGVTNDPANYNAYYYARSYAGVTKDGQRFSYSFKGDAAPYDNIHTIYGTSDLPIHYDQGIQVVLSYYDSAGKYTTKKDPTGTYYSRVGATSSYSVSINRVESPSTPEQEKWFCPYMHGLTTNGQEDRHYYDIYGYTDGRIAFKYEPTQEEWDATVRSCMYQGTIEGFQAICNDGKFLINRVYGFKEVDISEYLGKVEIKAPTTENGGLDLTGSSGTDYSDEYAESGMPFSDVRYVYGREQQNVISPIEKKDFVFLGWFDLQGNDLTNNNEGLYKPLGLSKEIIVPHYRVKEKDVSVSVIFDPGKDAPKGLSLSIDPGSSGCFSLSKEGEKWVGTFNTTVWIKDRTFRLPVISIEGMDEEALEYEFLGWEGEDGSFTVSSSDTEKYFKAVFRHNEKPAADDPAQGDPKQDDPTIEDPKQDDPTQGDPKQDDPTQGDPKQDDPAQDDPKQDDPAQGDPKQDDPTQGDPKQDDPTQGDPKQDEPGQSDPGEDRNDSELSERIKALNDELTALREEKAAADSKNSELVDSLNKKIAELEDTINRLSESMSKNDEVPASTERGGNSGSAGNTGRNSSGNPTSSYGQGTGGSSNRYETSTGSTSGNTYAGASSGEKRSEMVFATPSVSNLTPRSNDLSKAIAQPEPHYAYRASNGTVKLNYDTSVTASSKDTVEEYGFFSEGTKKEGSTVSSAKASSAKTSEKAAASSDEMKKAAGNTQAHDGGLLEAQNIGRSIFGVMILVIVTGCAIFFTFRKKAVKKNRRARK